MRPTPPLARLLSPLALLGLALSPLSPTPAALAGDTPGPETVTIPGTLQSELGCPGDWQPECQQTLLGYDPEDDVWQGVFEVRPGDDQDKRGPRYKVALNGSWGENYGANAARNGSDIPLVVSAPTLVKFYYDHKTHWVADNHNQVIATAMGSFQSELGCAQDDDPGCLRTWLQDPEGSGLYSLVTTAIPAGTYAAQVAIDEGLGEIYGQGGEKGGPPMSFTVKSDGDEIYFGYDPATHELNISTEGAPRGTLAKAQAYWVTRDTIVWNVVGSPKYSYALHYEPAGRLQLTAQGVEGGQALALTFENAGPGKEVLLKFPHLTGFTTLKLSPADAAMVPEILKGQAVVTVRDENGRLKDATALQLPGVLDDLYTYDGPLGLTYDGEVPTLRLWAPTAQFVRLHLYDDSKTTKDTALPMAWDARTGVWSVTGDASWTGRFYLYEVGVYVRATGRVEQNFVTDPYSVSLAMNSTRSQLVNLADPSLMPDGWEDASKPPLDAPEDIVIYELHIRDFSAQDPTVPAELRGTYRAFLESDSNGMRHLKALAGAGLTHIHLLPAFDIASVDEDRSQWAAVDPAELKAYPANSDQQGLAVNAIKDADGFNWGYDPFHFTTPEGSYSTDPDGPTRILEFRQMVQALNRAGLRVVMDVVYNHTHASGQDGKSVLDRIVPGYYHRLNQDGLVETSTCCQNTATEHAMMDKLMLDSVLTWATAYKVDGFRFDLMGHHMRSNMARVRQALDGLTVERDGVDGARVYVYGEGWDFGEVAGNARGENASQLNLGGLGIGTFNDRLRDAARGGGPFGDPREQGFLTGLFLDPSSFDQGSPEEQKARLLEYADWIRVGLAGNLRDYSLVNAAGKTVSGADLYYNGRPAGYAMDPQENVVYVSAHDNETLFDAIQWKAPAGATAVDRARIQNLGLSLVLLSQGVPFFHAGDDMLRSKSLDGNSYNSGDWFNALDFTFESNNWGVGLPPNGLDRKDLMAPLLGDPALKPSRADILNSVAHFQEMLKISRSSRLFRLQTAQEVQARLSFLNTGPDQISGLIVMKLDNTGDTALPDAYRLIVVLFNASRDEQTFADDSLGGATLELHPVLAASNDPVVKRSAFDAATGTFTVPGRTTAVFVLPAPQPAATPTADVPAAAASAESPANNVASGQLTLPWLILGGLVVAGLAGLLALRRRSAGK